MRRAVSNIKIIKYSPEKQEAVEETVAQEEPLAISLQGEAYQDLLYLPGQEKELVLGFLLTTGVINRLGDIDRIHFSPPHRHAAHPLASVEVWLNNPAEPLHPRPELPIALVQASLGATKWDETLLRYFPPASRGLRLAAPELLSLMAKLPDNQEIFRQTGATHAICLADLGGHIVLSAEDVGRHNAFDKVIGRALLEQIPFDDKIALLSGRISYEMAFKAGRAGIPILAAVSAPTHLAVRLAEALGITLAGFVRGRQMNIYTHPQRLTGLAVSS